MRTIPLHGALAAGRVAVVDDQDFEVVSQYRWVVWECRRRSGTINGPYAVTYMRQAGRSVSMRMHRLITGYGRTDHINHDGLDNQRSNLRTATASQNLQNARAKADTASPYKGVCRRGHRWRAQITIGGRPRSLGDFTTEVEAAHVYDTAALTAFGEYACLNFPG